MAKIEENTTSNGANFNVPPLSADPAAAATTTASLAAYIADMSAELAVLARRSDLPMLAYFLNLARVEAELRSRELGGLRVIRRRRSSPA